MPLIPVRIPRSTRPPIGTLVDSGNPLAQALRGAWPLNESGGNAAANAASGIVADASPTVWASVGVQRLRGPYTLKTSAQTFVVRFKTGSSVTSYQQLMGFGGRYLNNGDFTCVGLRIKGGNLHGIASPASSDVNWYNNLLTPVAVDTRYTAAFVLRGWGANTVGELWLNGSLLSTYTYTAGNYGIGTDPICLGMYANATGSTTDALFTGTIDAACHYGRALDAAEIVALSTNPWQIYEPETIWIPAGSGATYTENLTALGESYASVTDIATFVDAAEAIITAGVSVSDTVQMIEAVLTTAEAADTVSDTAARIDSLLSVIQAVDSVQDAAALVDNLVAEITATTSVTDNVIIPGVEALQTDVAAATSVQDVVVALEQLSTTIAAETTVTDAVVSATAENLLSAATAIASVTDLQLMVDNLIIVAQSQASLTEIAAYLEQLATTATTGASVTDVLVTAFVGTYIFRDLCTPRSFADLCTPRSFRDLCSPRGHA